MKILLIGDLHSNFTNIKKLNQKIIKFNLNYILINGDFINIYHDIENDSLSTDQEFLSVLNTILNNNNTPTLYIPGNHDPTIQFQNNHKNNLHKKWANLGPIDCFGLGGAVGGKLIFNGKEAFPGIHH
ncbi:Metallo-dependent phosphatase-like protein [Globomyces pollinis-pini]|nr:Metallo-dependent phosphatase-like protein [Globomyces pollinis-pini]